MALFAPHPRLWTVGDRSFSAWPLRVGDLFALAVLAEAIEGDPMEALPPPDEPSYPRALRDAAELAWKGGGGLWTAGYALTAGHCHALACSLRDAPPPPDECLAIVEAATPAEWRRLERIMFAVDPLTSCSALINTLLHIEDAAPEGVGWPKAVAETCRDFHYTPAEIMAMTLPEFSLLRSGGERRGISGRTTSESQKKRAAFWKDPESLGMGPSAN